MLTLSRHAGESIVITAGSTTIRVHVVYYNKNRCKLGFEAPRSVIIDREEIYLKKLAIAAEQIP